jgi:cephalosporin hydroxylase
LVLTVILAACIFLAYVGRHRIAVLIKRPVYDLFHYYYYRDSLTTWGNTAWMGVPLLKLPMDLWTYQEIIHDTKPDLIVETGTNRGGSALYFANLCDIAGRGRIITVDISAPPVEAPQHPRIEYIIGSSTSPEVLERIRSNIHLYSPLVTPGCYLVVEDTNVNGHPVFRSHGPGPMEALNDFLATNKEFSIDLSREKFRITFSPRGWLKRNASAAGAATNR